MLACPPLFPPKHGYLECSRPLTNSVDGDRITNRPGSQCILRCPTGYRETGRFQKICDSDGTWIGEETGACEGSHCHHSHIPFSHFHINGII